MKHLILKFRFPWKYALILLIGMAWGCDEEVLVPEEVKVTGIAIDGESEMALNVGGSERLTATIEPATATNKNIAWRTDNSAVATVTPSGWISAVGPGTAVISVITADGNKTDFCTVNVTYSEGSITAEERALANQGGIISNATILRAREIREKLNSNGLRSGAYIYRRSMIYGEDNNVVKLAARLKLLGIYDVYLSIQREALENTNVDARNWLTNFMAAAHEMGLTVWAMRFEDPSHYNSTGVYPNIDASLNTITTYNNSVNDNEKILAYSADYEPQMLSSGYTPWPSGLPNTSSYQWSTLGYVTGSNNTLLTITINMLKYLRSQIGNTPLHQAVNTAFSGNAPNYGGANLFLEPCDYLVSMSYYATGAQIVNNTNATMTRAAMTSKPKSVSVAIKPTINEHSGTINPRTWTNMMSIIDHIKTSYASQNVFRGVDFFEWEGLEQVWLTL